MEQLEHADTTSACEAHYHPACWKHWEDVRDAKSKRKRICAVCKTPLAGAQPNRRGSRICGTDGCGLRFGHLGLCSATARDAATALEAGEDVSACL